MPAALTHTAILLLAGQRLRQVRRVLRGRRGDFAQRVAYLADRALEMLTSLPRPALPNKQSGDPFFEVSKLAVLGAMGPDVPAFAALLAPGNAWVFDTVHKGTPDAHREAVRAGTTDLALAIWELGSARVSAAVSDPAERRQALSHLSAYVLGHLAHLAGDTVAHPYVHTVEWGRGTPAYTHEETEGSIDAQVARQVYGGTSTREGQRWDAWWPVPEEVPAWLPAAYADALERVYSLRTRRPEGFPEFEARHAELGPPALDAALIRDGFQVFRVGAVGVGYGWGWGHWFGALSLLALPMLALPALLAASPHARRYAGRAAASEDLDAARSEALTLPLAIVAFPALIAAILVAGITDRGVERYTARGLLSTGAAAALGLPFLGETLSGSSTATLLRWALVGVLAAQGLYHFSRLDVWDPDRSHRFHRPHEGALPAVHALPVLFAAAFFIVFPGSHGLGRELALDEGDTAGVAIAFWTLALLTGWIWSAKRLRDARIPEHPEELPAVRPHHIRLFDDSTLFHDPAIAAPTAADLYFPSGRRKLLEVWVPEGKPDLFLRSDGSGLAFGDDATTVSQTVPASGSAPMTAAQLVQALEAVFPGRLRARLASPTALDYVLPDGVTFASDDSEVDPPAAGDPPPKLGKVGAMSAPTAIYLAPKAAQAARFGRQGPVEARGRVVKPEGDVDGFFFVHQRSAEGAETVMDLAGDAAALLLLGGASHMLSEGERQARGIQPIHQVFRNWNLDRRRVDEWRLLVAGGATLESGAVLTEGEATARAVGWVPLLRKWLDAAARPEVDLTADQALNPNDPPPRALSRGLAFLLDMPDPVKVS
jgi:hypothetical protein